MSTENQDAETADEQRYPSPDVLHSVLAKCGLDPDNFTQMIDLAAVGMTVSWWRNTHVEDWHAGSKIGALSDVDMYRINTHTTAKVRERLRGWRRQHHITSMAAVAKADPSSLEEVIVRIYRWLTNPRRVLITGRTLYDIAAETLANARKHPDCDVPDETTAETELAEFDDEVNRKVSYLLVCMDRHDPRSVFYAPALASTTWATRWWGKPDYPAHVDAVFAAINDPGHRFWQGKPIPPPPMGTDLDKTRRLMLNRPWELPAEVCQWLIDELGEHYISGPSE